jgi:hypothetical protein
MYRRCAPGADTFSSISHLPILPQLSRAVRGNQRKAGASGSGGGAVCSQASSVNMVTTYIMTSSFFIFVSFPRLSEKIQPANFAQTVHDFCAVRNIWEAGFPHADAYPPNIPLRKRVSYVRFRSLISYIPLNTNEKNACTAQKNVYDARHQHEVEKGKYIERCIRKITGLRA